MKGLAILVADETYNERKAFILSCVAVSRGLIVAIQSNINKIQDDKLAYQVIELERQYINTNLAELTELARWIESEGIKKDEPYKYPSVRKRAEQLDRARQDHSIHATGDTKSGVKSYKPFDTCVECQENLANQRSTETAGGV